jgi:hypothetical protein
MVALLNELNDANTQPLADWRQRPFRRLSGTERIGGSSRYRRRLRWFVCLAKPHALRFSAAHNTLFEKRASRFGDDGALRFAVIIIAVALEHISPCGRMCRCRAPYCQSEPFVPRQFSVHYIINTVGFDFR